MEIFLLTLQQMLMMFTFIIVGYILRKTKILPENADVTLSRAETFFFVPAVTLSSLMKNCNIDALWQNMNLVIYGGIAVCVSVLFSYVLSRLFVKDISTKEKDYQRCIYRYAIAFGNYGYVGNFIVLGIWGDEGLFKYLMYCIIVGIVCSSWGLLSLIPKDKDRDVSVTGTLKRAFTTPLIIATVLGIILGVLNASSYMPEFLTATLENAKNCMGPVSMILAGFVVGGYDLKEMFINKKVYLVSFLRLIVLPAVFLLILKAFGVGEEICLFTLIAFAAPLGLNTIVYPATFGGETKTGASMTMISHALSVVTIPIMYYLFFVL